MDGAACYPARVNGTAARRMAWQTGQVVLFRLNGEVSSENLSAIPSFVPGRDVLLGAWGGFASGPGGANQTSRAQALTSLPQQLEGVGGGALRSGALRISPVFLDEVGLQGCGDFAGRLQRVADGPVLAGGAPRQAARCARSAAHGVGVDRAPAALEAPVGDRIASGR
jgi:hypothetical protein